MSINTVIATNIVALNTSRNLNSTNNKKSKYVNRLSSGIKINTASEDSASVTISQKLKAQIRGINVAVKNSEDAISLVETVESVYGEVQEMFQRCREITVQASNDTNSKDDKIKLMTEVSQLIEETDEMLNRTEFNGKSITELSGSIFQIGANEGQNLNLSTIDNFSLIIYDYTTQEKILNDFKNIVFPNIYKLENISVSGRKEGSVGTTIKILDENNKEVSSFNAADISIYVDEITESINSIDAYLYSDLNNIKSSLQESILQGVQLATAYTVSNWTNNTYNKYLGYDAQIISRGEEAILGTNYSDKTNNMNKFNNIINNPNGKLIITQISLEKVLLPAVEKAIENFLIDYSKLGKETFVVSIKDHVNSFIDGYVEDKEAALDLYLNSFDDFINQISDIRSGLGSFENRLKYTINNLQVSSENLSSANSLLEDTDMAKEMMNLTKVNVLANAANLLLSQSNSSKETLLELLF